MTTQESRLIASLPTGLYIAGSWQPAENDATLAVSDPATGAELTTVADASPRDGIRALDAAADAAPQWAATPPRTRSEMLYRAFELVKERSEDFALLMTLEMGKPLAEARGEVAYGAEFLRWFAEEAVRVTGRYGSNPEGTGTVVVARRPVGPCYLITPWNFPLAMATRKLGPALAAGCTAVIKPAALTPLTTLLLVSVLEEAGVPAGVVNVVTTSRSGALSEPILADPRLRKLSFTGSTPVGRALLAQAAPNVIRTSMELGGNAPFLVFQDADLEAAVEGAMTAKFRNIGQACTAANRFLVHRDVAEEFAARLAGRTRELRVGRGTEPDVKIGPLIDDTALQGVAELVSDARERGARVLTGGDPIEGAGSFFAPTVVTDVPESARLVREEIFGPVLAIRVFDDEDEAVELANATEYGLAAYAYTRDLARAHRLIERLETGMLGVNTGLVSNAAAPFGGVKQSGLGREGSFEGIDEYLETTYALLGGM